MKQSILVSAFLLGTPCRYDGTGKNLPELHQLESLGISFIPVCPEVLGGLPTPRPPAECQPDGTVRNREGVDVTAAFQLGAQRTLSLAQQHHCTIALLKERSPSCGGSQIYDGTFSGTLVDGTGITANLLHSHGISVYGESEFPSLLSSLKKLYGIFPE